jgi:hypothetical protein
MDKSITYDVLQLISNGVGIAGCLLFFTPATIPVTYALLS